MTHTAKDDRDYMRQVVFNLRGGDYALRTWDANARFQTGQHKIGYELIDPNGTILFTGEDMGVAPSQGIDSDEATIGCLTWFTLKPGDTDPEYFERYTETQLDWCKSDDAEELNMIANDWEANDPTYPRQPLVNIDNWSNE